MTAICLANMRSWKSASWLNTARNSNCVSLHHCLEVSNGRKWSRVFCVNGCPINETGKKSQPNGKLLQASGCFQGHDKLLSIAPMVMVGAGILEGVADLLVASIGS